MAEKKKRRRIGPKKYVPLRFALAISLTILETLAVAALIVYLAVLVPQLWIAVWITTFVVVMMIVNSDDKPDYKLTWSLVVIGLPIVGFVIYFMYYSRELPKKHQKRLKKLRDLDILDDSAEFEELKKEDIYAYRQALVLGKIADTHLYRDTATEFFDSGEACWAAILSDLMKAEKYILIEFFIIDEGELWDAVLDLLKRKIAAGVRVRLIYDDIGCMRTIPGNAYRKLREIGIDCVPFAMLRGQANNEVNNRSHRKIVVIDGKVAYTGGINIADEYVNIIQRFGHWKDVGIKLTGGAVREMIKLFLIDYAMSSPDTPDFSELEAPLKAEPDGWVMPFGSGPKPVYKNNVGAAVIMNMLDQAKDYVYITTPYLIIDNVMTETIENAARRGIDVRIITPHVPDKKIVFTMTRSSYRRLMKAGVKIFEYEPGFLHEKLYISDDTTAMTGSINLDYRSLVHHFEDGVWLYRNSSIADMKKDFLAVQNASIPIGEDTIKDNLRSRIVRDLVRIFSPLL